MSRETDTPSSGPNGRGGAAYPSGTPPYGIPAVSGDGADAGRSAAQPEERKTETTLTTRIRINIPGSRPIPPVVVRKPVNSESAAETAGGPKGSAEETGSLPKPQAPEAAPAAAAQPPAAEPAAPAEEKPTSDWFAPRKSPANKPGQGGDSANGGGLSTGSGGPAAGPGPGAAGPGQGATAPGRAGTPGASGTLGAPGTPGSGSGAGGAGPVTGRPGGVTGSMNLPGGSRSGSTGGSGLPGATGGPVAPGHGGGTGSFDVTEALTAGSRPRSGSGEPRRDEPRRDELPYFADGRPGGPGAAGGPGAPGGPQGPAGPTGGPVTGDGPLLPPGMGPEADFTVPPAPGTGAPAARPGGGLSDDTAVLTPQFTAPEPGGPGYGGRPDNVSGHTVTSGIPVVPPGPNAPFGQNAPFGPGTGGDGPRTHTPPKAPQPGGQSTAPAAKPAARPAKKKGRSKLVLLAGGVVAVAGVAYGAGLLMNHSDVPKGTTVLGVDIGGGTRDDAVKKLDDAFAGRVKQPLKLTVDGKTVTLAPDKAGLQFDTQATASAAAKSDYNPVSVIGSLFGNHRVVEPVMPVDEEKLQVALRNAAGGAGTLTDGTIKFEPGKAVAVYGKAGKGVDTAGSTDAVAKAYRTQVETGRGTPVPLPTTTRQPTVSDAEVDRMMKAFARPAMSALVTVRTDAAHQVSFSPQKSLWKFVRVKAIDGKLVEYYDKTALKELYGGAFDGVTIARGTGQKTPVTVDDVIGALRPALRSTTNRVGVIDTNPD
ncbi:hypothetical protein [Streptomyces sp. NPDC003374]